jgi:phosphatidylethanolamine-binding protein
MHLLPLLFLLPLVGRVVGQDTSLRAVKDAFNDFAVFPDFHASPFLTDMVCPVIQIPSDLAISFDPSVLLEVSLPQPSGELITLHTGIQLPRNGTSSYYGILIYVQKGD